MARWAELRRSFVEIVAVMGFAGFCTAVGVHFAVGYLDFFHLLPAFAGLSLFLIADGLLWAAWRVSVPDSPSAALEDLPSLAADTAHESGGLS
jgi:hypothetical protein